jgi:hypothetical protein
VTRQEKRTTRKVYLTKKTRKKERKGQSTRKKIPRVALRPRPKERNKENEEIYVNTGSCNKYQEINA